MSCEVLLPTTKLSSTVLQRRGRTLPEISIAPQDFTGNNDQDAFYDEFLQYLYSPASVDHTITTSYQHQQTMALLTKSPSSLTGTYEPSLATPKIFSEAELENLFVDIRSEVCLDVKTESFLNKTLLSRLSDNQGAKTNVKGQADLTYQDNEQSDNELLDSIIPKSPTVLSNGNCAFDAYFSFGISNPVTSENGKDSHSENASKSDPTDQGFWFGSYENNKENNNSQGVKDNKGKRLKKSNSSKFQGNNKKSTKGCGQQNTAQGMKKQNIIERRRRVEQHLRFQALASSVPHIAGREKIPKICILRAGIDYIRYLSKEEEVLLEAKRLEQEKMIQLHVKLEFLSQSY